jgi:hypothetical protein
MRRAAALHTCMALLLAFFVAPFQHVHSGHDSADHDHSALIHSHFYHLHSVAPSTDEPAGPRMDDVDDDHAAVQSLDTFTLVLTAGLSPFIPSVGLTLPFVPVKTVYPVEIVEERAHDPPSLDCSIPRAPPA